MFHTTITARVTRDPQLRYTPQGKAVVNLSLAHNSRTKDPATGQWVDAEVTFIEATFWEDYAENVASTLTQGDMVIVTGDLSVEPYEYQGQKRTKVVLRADEIGVALRFQTATVKRTQRTDAAAQTAAGLVGSTLGGKPVESPF